MTTEDYAKAIDSYNQGLEAAGTNTSTSARLLYERGRAYYYQQQYEQAAVDLSQAIDLNPQGRYHLLRGATYYEMSQYDAAVTDFSKSLTLDLSSANQRRALQYRAAAYERFGAYGLAVKDYETVLTLELTASERKHALARLEALADDQK